MKTKEKLRTKSRRIEGRSYMGYKVSNKKVSQNVPREKRVMKNRCNHTVTNKKKAIEAFVVLLLQIVTDKKFHIILGNENVVRKKKGFVQGLVNTRNIKSRRSGSQFSKILLDQLDES